MNSSGEVRRHDVVIVGARAAGAATAMLLARQGVDVLLLDRAVLPRDTLSTHAIARTGVVQLARWGLLDRVVESGAPPITEVSFHLDGASQSRRIKDRHGVDFLVAPRRNILDELLASAARHAGATVLTGAAVDEVIRHPSGRVVGVRGTHRSRPLRVGARVTVGADGLRSRMAKAVGSRIVEAHPAGGATFYAYFRGDWPQMEYHLGPAGFAGIFPTHHGEACIWACTPTTTAKKARQTAGSLEELLESLIHGVNPSLHDRVLASERRSRIRGAMALPNHLRQPVGPGWALVGDAGFHRDPITGHGLSDAFRDAELLASSVGRVLRGEQSEREALGGYHRRRDELLREVFEITVALAQFPPAERFTALQRQLSAAIDRQAEQLSSLRLPVHDDMPLRRPVLSVAS